MLSSPPCENKKVQRSIRPSPFFAWHSKGCPTASNFDGNAAPSFGARCLPAVPGTSMRGESSTAASHTRFKAANKR